MIKRTRIFLIVISFATLAIFCQPSYAFDFKPIDLTASIFNVVQGIGNFFSFFKETVIGKVRNDFCGNYYSSLASGEWKKGEFRTDLGERTCNGVVAEINANTTNTGTKTVSSNPIVPKDTTENKTPAKVPEVSKPSITGQTTPTKQVELPGLLVGNTNPDGVKINQTQIIYWTNIERNKMSLPQLAENNALDAIAMARVDDMFAKGYFEHTSPSGDSASLEADRLGYKYIVIGENIALGNFESTRALLDAWMASEGHKENILNNNYTEIGVSAKEALYKGSKVWISAQIFGKPLALCNNPSTSDKTIIDSYYSSANSMKVQAQSVLAQLNSMNPANDPNTYNTKVAEYNNLAGSINNIINQMKTLTTEYNNKVSAFNECIKLK